MKARIQALSAKFAALSRREQLMVAAACLAVVGMGGFTLWVDPARTRVAAIEKQLAQQRQDTATLREQLASREGGETGQVNGGKIGPKSPSLLESGPKH